MNLHTVFPNRAGTEEVQADLDPDLLTTVGLSRDSALKGLEGVVESS